jgi:hypothetical protein
MKKLLIALLIGGMTLGGMAVAAAENTAPGVKTDDSVTAAKDSEKEETTGIKLSGSINYEFRNDKLDAPNQPVKGYKTLVLLNAETNITKSLDGYVRASYEHFSNAAATALFKDFASDHYSGAVDAFGLEYSNADYKYVVGSQAFTLGATGILYDNGFVGKNALPYALNMTGKLGKTDLSAFVGQTNYQSGTQAKFYVAQASYPIGGKATLGTVLAKWDYGTAVGSHNYYTINSTYAPVKELTFSAEYLKSNYSQNNKGYAVAVDYKVDENNSLRAALWRVEWNASILDNGLGYMTTYWADAKGHTFIWKHNMGKNLTLALTDHVFSQLHSDGPNVGRSSFRAGITYNF